MVKNLFSHDYSLEWPTQNKFPINEETQGRMIKEPLLKDIEESTEFLIITGFTSLANIIEVFGTKDFTKLKSVRIVIGFEPDERVSKRLPHYSLTTEVKNYWLKQNVSIKLCGPILNIIEKIKRREIQFRVIDKLHAKIYVGDSAAILGSSNFSKSGISFQREANIRVLKGQDKTEKYQYDSIKQIAENYFKLANDYTEDILELFQKLLKDADWQEALARALAEILESKWMKDYPILYQAIVSNELWPTQKIGIARAMKIIQDQGNLLIADPTGSGKTKFATALAYTIFHWLAENGLKDRSNALIISPKQVVENWEREQSHFTLLNKIESMGKLSNSKGKSGEQLQKLIETIDILLVDEAHNYLNWNSKRSLSIKPKKSAHVILATATPINKKADDLLRLIELLDIDNLSDADLEEYFELRKKRKKHIDAEHIAKLKTYINQFIIRRTKKELNKMIEREPEVYKNSNGHYCKYPKAIAEIYQTGETKEDKEIAKQIAELLLQLKGVNYLQKLNFPEYLETEEEKQKYLAQRFNSAPALAAFEIRSALRSSRCALYESIYGTETAKKKFGIDSQKSISGNIIQSLKKCSESLPKRKFPDTWLSLDNKWITSEDNYKVICQSEIDIYEKIGQLALRLSDSRESTKAKALIENANRYGKILAFDSTVLTLYYIKKLIQELGTDAEVIVATGQNEKNKKLVLEWLNNANIDSQKKLIALCSDAMSESINLPAARALMLLDMPSVLRIVEQRIGRLERMDSEHKEIYVYWPDDAEEFSLKGDKRIIDILAVTENLIGNNVEIPQKGIYERYFNNDLGTKSIIKAYEEYAENEAEWEGVRDSTQQLYSLIEGKGALIDEKLYKEFKDVDATVKTAISFVETERTWSFFAFRGDSKRSPKWLLIDDNGKSTTDFSLICDRLKEYLGGASVIQRRWNEVNTQDEIQKIIRKLRMQERELLPWKKKRALKTGERILKGVFDKLSQDQLERKQLIKRMLDLFSPDAENETMIDYNHFSDLWLALLLPALDEKRKKQKRKRTIVTLRDLTPRDITISDENLNWLYNNCQYSNTLDEMIASCIISVKRLELPREGYKQATM